MFEKNKSFKLISNFREDAFVCLPDFMPNYAYFAVYDGHEGREAVDYVREKVSTIFFFAKKNIPQFKLCLFCFIVACSFERFIE